MRRFTGFVLIMSIFAMTSADQSDVQAVSAGSNLFANKLFAKISQPNVNLICSPLSVHTILSLAYQGSGGKTEAEFRNVLNLPDKKRTGVGFQNIMSTLNNVQGVTLEIANRIFVNSSATLRQTFNEVARKQFFAGAENVNFRKKQESVENINSWVREKTKNKITDILSPDDIKDDTVMVLVNAIYFKGTWSKPFKKSLTREEKFYTSQTDSVPCKMMHNDGSYNYKQDNYLNAQVLQMPYKNRDFSMVIVLPRQRTGLAALEKKLATYDFTMLLKDLSDRYIDLSLPKFKIESTIQLTEPLKKLGLARAFKDFADFTGLLNKRTKISKVVQKAFIDVNEEGAEAAAATAVMTIIPVSMTIATPFVGDHPFLFFIVYKRHVTTILFEGKITRIV